MTKEKQAQYEAAVAGWESLTVKMSETLPLASGNGTRTLTLFDAGNGICKLRTQTRTHGVCGTTWDTIRS